MEWRTNRADVTCDSPAPMSDNRYADIRLPGPLILRILLWLLTFLIFPVTGTAAQVSFKREVLGERSALPVVQPPQLFFQSPQGQPDNLGSLESSKLALQVPQSLDVSFIQSNGCHLTNLLHAPYSLDLYKHEASHSANSSHTSDIQTESLFPAFVKRWCKRHTADIWSLEWRAVPLAESVLCYLEVAEKKEFDPWLRDDIRIAWITVLEASRGNSQPHIDATYRVLGIHPDKVWPAIVARRKAILGRAVALPHNKKQPMAANREGNAPQKTCAYGAAGNTSSSAPRAEECRFSTGTSCSTETKREARRIRTSEFGLNDAPPAEVAASAVQTIPPKKRSQSVRNLAQEKGVI